MSKRILVTGGSGFIGTNIVEYYRSIGDVVINIDIQKPRNLDHLDLWREMDILDYQQLSALVQEFLPDVVFHLGARTDLDGADLSDYSANTVGVSNLISALNHVDKIAMVVFASSMLVCKLGFQPQNDEDYCPDTVYGESKVLGEKIIRSADTKFQWIIVRPTSIWGPWFGRPYCDFFNAVKRNLYVHPKDLRVRRSYGFIYNTVYQLDCLGKARDTAIIGKTFYLADYKPIELKDWADRIQESFNVKPIKEAPVLLFKLAARIGDIFKFFGLANPPMTSFRLRNMATEMVHDTRELEVFCGETPFSHRDGVEVTCAWMMKELN